MKLATLIMLALVVPDTCCVRGGGGSKEGAGDSSTRPQERQSPKQEAHTVVKVAADVSREARIATARAEVRRLAATVDLTGQIVPDPDGIAVLSARASGRVLKVLAREGDEVRAGRVVALLSSPELARLRAEYEAQAAKAAAARQNATRLQALIEQRLGAEQDALSAAAEATAAEAARDAAARTIRSMGAPLRTGEDASLILVASPIAGQVIQRAVVPGQMVGPETALATVADLSRVWFQAQLFEKDLGRVREGAMAEVRLNSYPDVALPARVARISAQVDPQTRALTVRLAIKDDARRIRLGLYGTARIEVAGDQDEPHIVVPASAVTDIEQRKAVFVRRPDGDFEIRPVTSGKESGGVVELLAGVQPGEEVVVSGVHNLKSIVLKSTLGEEE
jgi:membrane fusion protein, heavy metal efflux system